MKISHLLLFSSILLAMSCQKEVIPTIENNISFTNFKLIQDNFENTPIVVIGSQSINLIRSFKSTLPDGTSLSFTPLQDELPIIMKDETGNKWDMWGKCVKGDRIGSTLIQLDNWMGFWFSFSAFYPNTEIYGEALVPRDFTITPPSEDWLVAREDVYAGAPKNAIVAVDNPTFYAVTDFIRPKDQENNETPYLVDSTLIIGLEINGETKAYPHSVLNWHEIVNDYIGGEAVSIIYCPLTGTSSAWSRVIDGQTTTFGVSGLVYNSNVVPYDRASDSNWSQLKSQCINGTHISKTPQTYSIVETTWAIWKQTYPNTLVMSDKTPQSHNCSIHPYSTYGTREITNFPLTFVDNRMFSKTRVHAIIVNEQSKVYPMDLF